MKRKLIEWTLFAIIAAGAVLLVRRFVPWAILRYYHPNADAARVFLRQRLRDEERKLSTNRPSVQPGKSGLEPCLVIPAPLGVGARAGSQQSGSVRDCLDLIPGGPPTNAVEFDLRSGSVILVQTDMYLPGHPPITFTRVIEPLRNWNLRFQVFLPNEYDAFPSGDRFPFTFQKLQLADRQQVLFRRISKGTGYAHAVYEQTETISAFYHAIDGWNGNGWDVDLADGRTLVFPASYYAKRPQQGALTALRGPSGAELRLSRDSDGNLHWVASSNGRWMKLGYEGSAIVSLSSSNGEKAAYAYDKRNLLSSSTNADGQKLSYKYDKWGELLAVTNAKSHAVLVSANYDARTMIASLRVAGAGNYRVEYRRDPMSHQVEIYVSSGRGEVWTLTFGKCTDTRCMYEVKNHQVAKMPLT